MKKHLQYLNYVIRHKWYVMLACFRRGMIWQGIVHDMSKFRPSEWFPYAEFFYGAKYTNDDYRRCSMLGICIKSKQVLREEFDAAWLLHQHRNPHHWQYWVLRNDNGTTEALEMPRKYLLEMLADWEGAGMAITGKREYREWYLKNREKMLLHPMTRLAVEDELEIFL